MAQRNQFDPQNQIFLKVWQKPYSSVMKTGMKLNISTGEKESGSGSQATVFRRSTVTRVCRQGAAKRSGDWPLWAQGRDSGAVRVHRLLPLQTTGSFVFCCGRNISSKPGRPSQKLLYSLTHLDRCLSNPLPPKDRGPRVRSRSPAGR